MADFNSTQIATDLSGIRKKSAEISKAVSAMRALQQETVKATKAEKERQEQEGKSKRTVDTANLALTAAKEVAVFFKDAVVAGVRFNATLETTQVILASALKTKNPEQFKTFDQALQRSTGLLEQLKRSAANSPATFEQLAQTLQGAAGAMSTAGVSVENQVRLITKLSEVMAGAGISAQEMREETAALLAGTADGSSRLAKILHVSDGEVAAAKAKGALFEFLSGKLGTMEGAAAAAQNNISQLENKLKDTTALTAAKATTELTNSYRDLLKALVDLAKSPAFATLLENSSAAASTIVKGVASVARTAAAPGNSEVLGISAGTTAIIASAPIAGILLEDLGRKLKILFDTLKVAVSPLALVTMAIGALLVALVGAKAKIIELKLDTAKDQEDFDDARLQSLRDTLNRSRDPATQQRVEAEAMRRSRQLAQQADEARRKNDIDEANRLSGLSRRYSLIVATIREKGAAIIAVNLALDEQAKKTAKINNLNQERAAASKELAAEYDKNRDEADAARFAAMNDAAKLEELRRRQLEATAAVRLARKANEFGQIDPASGNVTVTDENIRAAESEQLAARNKLIAITEQVEELEAKINRKREETARREEGAERKRQPDVATPGESHPLVDENGLSSPGGTSSLGGTKTGAFSESLQSQLTQLRSGFLSAAQAVTGVFHSAIDGVAGSVSGLLKMTMSWGDALRNIAGSIMNSVINSISRMFAEWIVGIVAKSAAEKAAGVAEVAAKTPGALLTSISSFGVAAGVGLAALLGVMALTKGFSSGGYTGSGEPLEPAGVVHRGEVVFSQADIARHGGVAAVEALRISSGMSARGAGVSASPAAGGVGGPAIGDGQAPVNIAYFNTRQDAETWLVSQRGTRVLKDWMRDNRYDT